MLRDVKDIKAPECVTNIETPTGYWESRIITFDANELHFGQNIQSEMFFVVSEFVKLVIFYF